MNWKPQDDFCVRFSDETAKDRSDDRLNEMVEGMREVANKYGFDISCWGSWRGMGKVMDGERAIMKEYEDRENARERNQSLK